MGAAGRERVQKFYAGTVTTAIEGVYAEVSA
jgi:hypothetical protein